MYLADSRRTDARGTDSRSTEAAIVPDSRPGRWPAAVPGPVLALGAVSLITDISSEMITAVLPLYVVAGLGLSPLGFGLLDGINNGVGALVRLAGGHLADRGGRRHKLVAGLGYGLSALCKPFLLLAHTLPVISAVLAADRTGKGLRTAPRDAMISLATEPRHRGRAFGVHRAMDTTGALLGPLAAFAVLRATVDGYDAVFLVSGCVAALGVLVLVLFVPGEITATGAAPPPTAGPAPAPPGARRPLDPPRARGDLADPPDPPGARGALADPPDPPGARGDLADPPDPPGARGDLADPSDPPGARGALADPPGLHGDLADPPGPTPPHPSHRSLPSRPTLRDSLGLLRRPRLRRLTLCAALLGLTTVSDSFLYLLLQREEGMSAHLFPLLPLGTAAVFLLLAVPLGALADRIGRRRLFLGGHGVLLLGYGLVLCPWHGLAALAAVLVLHGTFYAATDGVLAAATAGAVEARHQGAGQALVGTGQALARFACSLAFGAAWSVWGGRTALAVVAVALAGAAVAASFVLRTIDEVPA
ncbi:MFS transporter [Streptomyces sp. NPDC056373]|uniref:MFS transporter n=1 Tax=Streptomyces sp. NPDC056373 TaxID=3345798 RepID=UPI0035DB28BC